MPADPRTFTVSRCDINGNKLVRKTTKKKGFFDSLGKVGDLELLNEVGGGAVGEGLRALAATSDSIRIGQDTTSAVKFGGANGPYEVLDESGINAQDVPRAAQFNPGVANRALGEARNIADKVSQGNFDLSDIPQSFSDIQNLSSLIGGIFPGSGGETEVPPDLCGAAPYATSLISYAPKFKYLFVVQITFNQPFQGLEGWTDASNSLAFVVKYSQRPTVEFEYEEINQYNYRTRVAKRTVYPPITMRFYDDNKNNATNFHKSYLNAMSPISNMGVLDNDNQPGNLALKSMDNGRLTRAGAQVQRSGASLGALIQDPTSPIDNFNVIKDIKLFHIYHYGSHMNVYNFSNPKILSITPDDLDMAESGNGSEMEVQFAYDGLYIEDNVGLSDLNGPSKIGLIKTLTSNQNQDIWKIDPVFADSAQLNPTKMPDADDQNIIVKAGSAVTDLVTGVLDAGTGLVSKAFDAVEDFAGSVFK